MLRLADMNERLSWIVVALAACAPSPEEEAEDDAAESEAEAESESEAEAEAEAEEGEEECLPPAPDPAWSDDGGIDYEACTDAEYFGICAGEDCADSPEAAEFLADVLAVVDARGYRDRVEIVAATYSDAESLPIYEVTYVTVVQWARCPGSVFVKGVPNPTADDFDYMLPEWLPESVPTVEEALAAMRECDPAARPRPCGGVCPWFDASAGKCGQARVRLWHPDHQPAEGACQPIEVDCSETNGPWSLCGSGCAVAECPAAWPEEGTVCELPEGETCTYSAGACNYGYECDDTCRWRQYSAGPGEDCYRQDCSDKGCGKGSECADCGCPAARFICLPAGESCPDDC